MIGHPMLNRFKDYQTFFPPLFEGEGSFGGKNFNYHAIYILPHIVLCTHL